MISKVTHRGTAVPQTCAHWICPPALPGSTIFVIGNGPSLLSAPVDRLQGKHLIAVNSAVAIVGQSAQFLFFGDASWYWTHKDMVQSFAGQRVTLSRYWIERDGTNREEPCHNEPGLLTMRQKGLGGLCLAADALCWNRSSGGSAVDLAAHLGAKNIVLVGFDFHSGPNGERNAVPYADEAAKSANYEPMADAGMWVRVAAAAKDRKIAIVNATPGSNLKVFPFVNLEDVT